MALIERWVNDQLYDILGISDKYIAQYFIGLASKASSPDDFIQRLKDTGTVEVNSNLTTFAKDLFSRVICLKFQRKSIFKYIMVGSILFYVMYFYIS